MSDDRCTTTSGSYRCSKKAGHQQRGDFECETEDAPARIPLGPYRDTLRTNAYVRGMIDHGVGGVLDLVGRHLGVPRCERDDCAYRVALSRAL